MQNQESSNSNKSPATPSSNQNAYGVPVPSSLRLGVLALCLVLWVVGLVPRLAYGPKFSNDSASYIDCARSVIEGRGFMVRPFGGLTQNLWEPMTLWPPGYPLLITPLMKLGVSPTTAGTAVATFFSFICVVFLGNLYLTRLPTLLALPTLGATVLMPSFLLIGGMAWSEASYLALSLGSLLCMINWTKKSGNHLFVVLAAGIFCGLAWSVRNIAVALLGASLLFLGAHLLWRPFRVVAKAITLWLLGFGASSGWLVLHNLNSFGRITPYSMPPSDLSLWDNLKRATYVLAKDLFFPPKIAEIVTNKYLVIPLLSMALLILGYSILKNMHEKRVSLVEEYRVELLIFLYITILILVTVVARTKYRWGELIGSRHFVLIYWAIWLLFPMLCLEITSRFMSKRHCLKLAILIMMLCFSLQAHKYLRLLEVWKNDHGIRKRIDSAQMLSMFIPRDKIVLSDRISELRIVGDVHARDLYEIPPTISEIRKAGEEGFLWGIVIWDAEKGRRGKYGETARDLLLHPDHFPEFRQSPAWRQPLVFQYVEPARSKK